VLEILPAREVGFGEEAVVFTNLFRSPFLYVASVGLLAVLAIFRPGAKSNAAVSHPSDGPPRPVVVELFTSEGCSSCPPADALLKRLSEQQPIEGAQVIALEEHVDYWNLRWSDPFSSNTFSQRQEDYARSLGTDNVYTPQMVVDGEFELVGSRGSEARNAIQKAANSPKLEVVANSVPNSSGGKSAVEVQISNPRAIMPHEAIELWVAITETNLQSDVKAGENSGETLKHAAVVRSLRKVETLQDFSHYKRRVDLSLDSQWKKENLGVVVFVAEKTSHKIIGVGVTPLHP
jgi:hypothetical protein